MDYKFDAPAALSPLLDTLAAYKRDTNCRGVALGLSGGKDSTVAAMLAKKVFGDAVFALLLPDGEQKDIADSLEIARTLGVKFSIVNIESITKAAIGNGAFPVSPAAAFNVPPRIRMTLLYAAAQSLGYRVMGTSNLSEAYVGWCTKFGDTGCDFNPLANLTKTEVVEIGKLLAKEFSLDVKRFIEKPPADGLTGRTDEENFGFTYATLDRYIRTGICEDKHIKDMIDDVHAKSGHKRAMPAAL